MYWQPTEADGNVNLRNATGTLARLIATNGHFHTHTILYDCQGACEYVLVIPCNNNDYIINIVQETIKSSAVEIKRIIVRILSGDAILQFFKLAIM